MSSKYPRRTFLKLGGATLGAAALGTGRTTGQEVGIGVDTDYPITLDVPNTVYELDEDVSTSVSGPAVVVAAPGVTLNGGGHRLVNDGGPAVAVAPTATTSIMTEMRVKGSGTSLVNLGPRNYFFCVSVEETSSDTRLPGILGAGHGVLNFGSASRFELMPVVNNAGAGMYVPSFGPELESGLSALADELGVGDRLDESEVVDVVGETEPVFNATVGSLFVNNGLDGYCQGSPWANRVSDSYAAGNGGDGFAYRPPPEAVDPAATSESWRTLADLPSTLDIVRDLLDDIAENLSAESRMHRSTSVNNAGNGLSVEWSVDSTGLELGLAPGYDLNGSFLSNGGDGIRVEGSLGTRIAQGLAAGNAGDGLSVREATDFVASETTSVENGGAGASVSGSSGIELFGYTSLRNLSGFEFRRVTDVDVRRATVVNNDRGVRMTLGSEVFFAESFVGLNGDGIELLNTIDSVLTDNDVLTNDAPAFTLGVGTTGNELVDNRLKVFEEGVEKIVEAETGANEVDGFRPLSFWPPTPSFADF